MCVGVLDGWVDYWFGLFWMLVGGYEMGGGRKFVGWGFGYV